jgi:hypothetical protein
VNRSLRKLKGSLFLTIGLIIFMVPVGSIGPNDAFARQSGTDVDSLKFGLPGIPVSWQLPAKKSCTEVYPLPDGYDKWNDCTTKGQSACGGPQQCACNSSQVLVTYTCQEGTYNICKADASCN